MEVRTSHEFLTVEMILDFYKKDVNFFMLGPVGDKIEQWTLKDVFITTFNDLDFSIKRPYRNHINTIL